MALGENVLRNAFCTVFPGDHRKVQAGLKYTAHLPSLYQII